MTRTTRTTLSSEELGISPELFEALKRVRYGLANNLMRHVPYEDEIEIPRRFNFNMAYSGREAYNCGTIACIGGWAYIIMNGTRDHDGTYKYDNKAVSDFVYRPPTPQLRDLFFPGSQNGRDEVNWGVNKYNYKTITPEQAVKAIDNYLNTGDANWQEILTDENFR